MQRSLIILSLMLISESTTAQDRQFPYQAQVTVEEAYVRSGGGEKFYPTMSMKRGSVVTVLRHDPGGWLMIKPPEGSFSWIATKFVSSGNDGTAEISVQDSAVFVGSVFGDETSVWQRSMQPGERVTILGQKLMDTHSGAVEMFKIAPPAREFRWIPGAAVMPTDKRVREANDRNPYKVPAAIAERDPARPTQNSANPDSPSPNNQPRYVQSEALARLKIVRAEQRALQQLDQRFRTMILSHPSQWDLDKLERDYLDLQQRSTHKPVAGQIDLRYPAIYRYRQRKAQLEDFKRLTSQTEQRDAQLMAIQFGLPAPSVPSTPPLASNFPRGAGTTFGPTVQSTGSMLPVYDSRFSGSGVAPNNITSSPNRSESVAGNNKYIGAGVLQRDVGGKSNEFLLTNPQGRILARIAPTKSVNLEQFVGQSVGVQGKRWFDPEASTDRIEVSALETVVIRN